MGNKLALEPDFAPHYEAWKAAPTPETNRNMLTVLQPTIEGAIKTHVGTANPLLMSQARRLTLESLKSYDPYRSRLGTHIYNQLQGLKRINRKQTLAVRTPERVVIDNYQLDQAEKELEHNLGRSPSLAELADHTGFSPRRIQKVRRYHAPVAEGQITDQETGAVGYTGDVKNPWDKKRSVWLQMVYDDMDPYHQKIMDLAFGLTGRAHSNQEIAEKMQRSPGAISQAKARIQAQLDAEDTLSPFGAAQ